MGMVLASRTSTRKTPHHAGSHRAPVLVSRRWELSCLRGIPAHGIAWRRTIHGCGPAPDFHRLPLTGSTATAGVAGCTVPRRAAARQPGETCGAHTGVGDRPPDLLTCARAAGIVTPWQWGIAPRCRRRRAPIVALDVSLLAGHFATALARVPFRRPFSGRSSPLSNLGITVTREVIRAFMGYSSSLRIPEFRSLELVLDDICKRIMPPIVRSLDVDGHTAEFGGVPGILYVPRQKVPEGVVLYLHGGGYIGTSPNMYAFFTAQVCRQTGCAVFVADYRLAPEFPYPAGAEDASAIYTDVARPRHPVASASSSLATRAVAAWPTPCCSRTPRRSTPCGPAASFSSPPRSTCASTRTPSRTTRTTTFCPGTFRPRPTCTASTSPAVPSRR